MKTFLVIIITAAVTWMASTIVDVSRISAERLWLISAIKVPGKMALRDLHADMNAGQHELAAAKLQAFLETWQRFDEGPDSFGGYGIGDVMLAFAKVETSFVTPDDDLPVPSSAPPARLSTVSLGKDGHSLVVRYEASERSHEQVVAFTNEITDFRYCRWLDERGVAVVASTRSDEFYYAAFYLAGGDAPITPRRIPVRSNKKSRLLGIANTGGDSLVVTAVEHRRDGSDPTTYGPDRLSGWMFIDNCPPVGALVGLVVPFEIPAKQTRLPAP